MSIQSKVWLLYWTKWCDLFRECLPTCYLTLFTFYLCFKHHMPTLPFSLSVLDNCARPWHVISQKPLTLCPSQIRSVFNRQLISLLPLWLSFSLATRGNAQLYIINLTALPSATTPPCHEVYRSHGPTLSAYKEQSKQPASFHVALMVLTLIYKVTKESLCMCKLFASFAECVIAQNNIVKTFWGQPFEKKKKAVLIGFCFRLIYFMKH